MKIDLSKLTATTKITRLIAGYFQNLHDVTCNQKYAKTLPYSFHLDNVYRWATAYRQYWLTDTFTYLKVYIGIYGHDSIEDARLTFNDIVNLDKHLIAYDASAESIITKLCADLAISYQDWRCILADAAEIIYACSEEKGRNREERHSDKFYDDLIKNELAVFVKLCDLIANSTFSLNQNGSMFVKYKTEFTKSHNKLLSNSNLDKFSPMYNFLSSIYNLHFNLSL